MFGRGGALDFSGFLLVLSLPLVALATLLEKLGLRANSLSAPGARRTAGSAHLPDEFAFYRAIEAYERLLDEFIDQAEEMAPARRP